MEDRQAETAHCEPENQLRPGLITVAFSWMRCLLEQLVCQLRISGKMWCHLKCLLLLLSRNIHVLVPHAATFPDGDSPREAE